MKKIILVAVCFLFSHLGFAQEVIQPHIEVFGKSTIEVKPDTMIWNLQVKTTEANLNMVSQKHSDTVKNVLHIIRSKQVKDSSVQTSRMSFNENRVYKDRTWYKEGYIANTSVTFKLTNFNNYEPLWFALSKVKGVSINNVSFDHSDRIGFRNKARKQALLAAKNKANIMAETLGVKVGMPISISEITYTNNSSFNSNMVLTKGSGGASDSSLSVGMIPVSAKVKLVIGIITK